MDSRPSSSHYDPYWASGPPHPHLGIQPASPADSNGYYTYDTDRSPLSLNMSALSVTSPASSVPVTPISPNSLNTTPHQHAFPHIQQYPSYGQPSTYPSSRSSSASEKSVPRKRSFTGQVQQQQPPPPHPLPTPVEDPADAGMYEPGSYDDGDNQYPPTESSPIESHADAQSEGDAAQMSGTGGTSSSFMTKPSVATSNNFVTKLYQMITDPKSARFIQWTELGTSFVVSNVGEFSRTILGSHFKHNNFSSFVRQLNMYGFHKINRTPRAQRTSTDAQTWEFSHLKFLRGRPDLLDEIKRKALEPDPSFRHRIELPGEVALQLNQIRDENKRTVQQLQAERQKVERLTQFSKVMYDFLNKAFPGQVPFPFPADLLEPTDSPPIFVTSPVQPLPSMQPPQHYPAQYPHHLRSLTPSSSPTASDFPIGASSAPPSRQQSLQHLHIMDTGAAASTPLPPSPAVGNINTADDLQRKRQRTGDISDVGGVPSDDSGVSSLMAGKRLSRARSDSAPLGYALGNTWAQGRPRSGSTMSTFKVSGRGPSQQRDYAPTVPMLSIPQTAKEEHPSPAPL